jgi:capsular polysaccharide biosynthesis protein
MLRSSLKNFYARRLRSTIAQMSRWWIVAMRRVRSATQLPMDDDLRVIKSALSYEPIQVSKPLFFVAQQDQIAQLKDYLENPNLRPYEPKIIEAKNILLAAPSMVQRWRGVAFIEALLDDVTNISYPRLVLEFETMHLRPKKLWPTSVLLALPLYSNYFHWTVELLPRLQLLEGNPDMRGLPLIVPADAPQFVRETLRLSGYLDRVQFVERGVHRFASLYIPSLLSPPSHPSPIAISWLRDKLTGTLSLTNLEKKRRLYVSRRDAPTRYASNELEVEAMLGRFGFETVKMSDYSVAEQIALFSQAHIIVGVHGAALTNLVFCSPGTYVLELFLQGWFTNAFYHISLIRKLYYGYLVCPKDGEGQYVPLKELETLIVEVFKHIAERHVEAQISSQ